MVLEIERILDVEGSGDFPIPPDVTGISDDDDPRDLTKLVERAFDNLHLIRPEVKFMGTRDFGTLYSDEAHLDINRIPGKITREGVTPETINVTIVSALGWASIDSEKGILSPNPEFADLQTPTPEQARANLAHVLGQMFVETPLPVPVV